MQCARGAETPSQGRPARSSTAGRACATDRKGGRTLYGASHDPPIARALAAPHLSPLAGGWPVPTPGHARPNPQPGLSATRMLEATYSNPTKAIHKRDIIGDYAKHGTRGKAVEVSYMGVGP